MQMTVIDIIKTICKNLHDSPSLSSYIQIAEESTNRRFFGTLYNQAVAYKACHLWTLYGADSSSGIAGLGSGAISGVSEGSISVSFAVPSDSDSSWSTTKYGRMYLDLLKTRPRMDVNRLGGCYGI